MTKKIAQGFLIRGLSLADGLLLLGEQGRWIQPFVDAADERHFAHELELLADELVAARLFEEAPSASLVPLVDKPLSTIVATRIAAQERARKHDGRSTAVGSVHLDLWLAPFLGSILGRVRQGPSAVYRRLLQVPGIEDYSYAPAVAKGHTLAMRESAERGERWTQVLSTSRACPVAMQWAPSHAEFAPASKLFQPVATRATRLARSRAIRQFCVQAQAANLPDFPPSAWVPRAERLLAFPTSPLSTKAEGECARLMSTLLPPAELCRSIHLPVSSFLGKGGG